MRASNLLAEESVTSPLLKKDKKFQKKKLQSGPYLQHQQASVMTPENQ